MTEFACLDAFNRDLKKLLKKYGSLEDDLKVLGAAILAKLPDDLTQIGIVRVANLHVDPADPVYKVRHFRCRSLKGRGSRSGIRVIFAYNQAEDLVTFIEIYHKEQQANEDRDRIRAFLSSAEG